MTETTFKDDEDDREPKPVEPETGDDDPDSGDEPYDPDEEESPVLAPGDTSVAPEADPTATDPEELEGEVE